MPALDAEPRAQFTRTTCACVACVTACLHMPGGLIPGDAERMAAAQAASDFETWAVSCLAVSEGAELHGGDGEVFRLPTIVPRSNPDGSCVFLKDKKCSVHEVAPYGCAFLDMHMGREDSLQRGNAGLKAVAWDWAHKGPYSQLWAKLYQAGNVAAPMKDRRAKLRVALEMVKSS